MLQNANLLISAWEEDELIGLARSFVDYAWVCYLSDLLVDTAWQKRGVGTALLAAVREEITDQCQLVLLSAPDAMEYYPKTGFEKASHAYYIKRPV